MFGKFTINYFKNINMFGNQTEGLMFKNFTRLISFERKLKLGNPYMENKYKKKPDKIMTTPQRKGIVVKLVKLKPKKPNSGNRRCVVVRLNDNKLVTAFIPGENGVVQEHGTVLIYKRPVIDVPGLKYRVIRHKLDMK